MTTNSNANADKIASTSAEVILGPNPVVGVRVKDLVKQAGSALKLVVRKPKRTAQAAITLGKSLVKVAKGESELEPSAQDRRWKDSAWKEHNGYKTWLKAYLALNEAVSQWIDTQTDLTHIEKSRLEFLHNFVSSALAPTNFPIQPEAVRKFKETNGASAVSGIKNLIRDIRENKGMPAQVDKTPFTLGVNLAATEGSVILRTDLMELIQYKPQTEQVYKEPLLVVPPQINKFYVFDLTQEKSLVKGLVSQGFQVFMVSWKNPEAEHKDWGLAEYAAAIDIAVSTTCGIANTTQVNLLGACAGGVTLSSYLATRSYAGDKRVASITLLVNALDMGATKDTGLGLFASPSAIEAAKKYSSKNGVLDGRDMANTFAWLRPNDLVWNYWVNNILLGNAPPANEILYWNNDSTRLPARLHSEFLDIYRSNAMMKSGVLRLHGLPVDLTRITCDAYIVAGTTDHITPWKACYRSTQLFKGKNTFVLSNSGHIQSILNPIGNKKAEFWADGNLSGDADAWAASANHQKGSWWTHWFEWLGTRSGKMKNAPKHLGNKDYPELVSAPGSYIHD